MKPLHSFRTVPVYAHGEERDAFIEWMTSSPVVDVKTIPPLVLRFLRATEYAVRAVDTPGYIPPSHVVAQAEQWIADARRRSVEHRVGVARLLDADEPSSEAITQVMTGLTADQTQSLLVRDQAPMPTPAEIARHIPDTTVLYSPEPRQSHVCSWPNAAVGSIAACRCGQHAESIDDAGFWRLISARQARRRLRRVGVVW